MWKCYRQNVILIFLLFILPSLKRARDKQKCLENILCDHPITFHLEPLVRANNPIALCVNPSSPPLLPIWEQRVLPLRSIWSQSLFSRHITVWCTINIAHSTVHTIQYRTAIQPKLVHQTLTTNFCVVLSC